MSDYEELHYYSKLPLEPGSSVTYSTSKSGNITFTREDDPSRATWRITFDGLSMYGHLVLDGTSHTPEEDATVVQFSYATIDPEGGLGVGYAEVSFMHLLQDYLGS